MIYTYFLKIFRSERGIIPVAATEAGSAGQVLAGEHQTDDAQQNRNHERMAAVLVGIEHHQTPRISVEAC